jgi:uncharacterized iron-regulated membrane protein
MRGARQKLRRTFLMMHRWTAIVLFVLLVPISFSGTVLVFQSELDALINPARYAVSGDAVLPPVAYFTNAASAVDGDARITSVRFPQDRGPVVVQARAEGESGPPQIISVYLDPPTARVLDTQQFRSSAIGFLHRFHENLTVPAYSGRAIVGWAGVGMLLLSLSGIYLWWPRDGVFVPGLRWRRAQHGDRNLHHLFGFWIFLPLALVSFTGIYLAFPPQSRAVMSAIATVSPQGGRARFAGVASQTTMTADASLKAAGTIAPDSRPVALFVPPARGPLVWRVQFRRDDGEMTTVLVNDSTRSVTAVPDQLSGDRAAQWIRWIHEGSRGGPLWRVMVALTGLVPTLLGITGILMWLRERRVRRARWIEPVRESLRAAE